MYVSNHFFQQSFLTVLFGFKKRRSRSPRNYIFMTLEGHTCITLPSHPVNWFWASSVFFLPGAKKSSQETPKNIASQNVV